MSVGSCMAHECVSQRTITGCCSSKSDFFATVYIVHEFCYCSLKGSQLEEIDGYFSALAVFIVPFKYQEP